MHILILTFKLRNLALTVLLAKPKPIYNWQGAGFLSKKSTFNPTLVTLPIDNLRSYRVQLPPFMGVNDMYAVIKTGGKQYQVAIGDKLKIELIPADIGSTVTFSEVLLVADGEDIKIGAPVIANAQVTAEVIATGRHKKIRIFKMNRRKHFRKNQGHRQDYTEVEIKAINQ